MRKFILLYLLLAVAGLAFCSCELFAEDELVEFTLPDWPDYMPELVGWKIDRPFDVEVPPNKRHVSFRLPKNQPVCITVTPLTQNQFFKPAGTIYPYSQKITWSGGYAAHLYKVIHDSEQFNWGKLLETLEQKQNDSLSLQNQQEPEPFYNPWLLDSQEVLEGIAFHNFTAAKIKLKQTLCVSLDFEVFSSYVPENELFHQKNQTCVTVKTDQPEIFALRQSSGTPVFYVIICASSAKNISLDLVSLPIFKEEL